MIIFTSLLIALIVCTVFAAMFLITGSVAFIVVFGDAIVFTLLVWWIIKGVRNRKK